MQTQWTRHRDAAPKRSLWTAMRRGLFCRCPACGEGKIFRAFLKVADKCPACGEDMHHHRADDLPAYLVIVVVGHIVVPVALAIEKTYAPNIMLQLAVYLPLTAAMTMWLIQPIKGSVVGLQWAMRMHGFDENSEEHTIAASETARPHPVAP